MLPIIWATGDGNLAKVQSNGDNTICKRSPGSITKSPQETWCCGIHEATKDNQLLAHSKDKRSPQDTVGVVYSIPCKQCHMVYIGETERRYGVREQEHMKDVKQLKGQIYTRSRKRVSQTEIHQSVLTDHVRQKNHSIDWGKHEVTCQRTELQEERHQRP